MHEIKNRRAIDHGQDQHKRPQSAVIRMNAAQPHLPIARHPLKVAFQSHDRELDTSEYRATLQQSDHAATQDHQSFHVQSARGHTNVNGERIEPSALM